ncbi:MAG: hypothetical protein ABI305_11185 [Tepidiformaceae bacterium]
MKGFVMVLGAVALIGGLACAAMMWMRGRNGDDEEWEDDYNPELARMQSMRNGVDGSAMSAEQAPTEAMQH